MLHRASFRTQLLVLIAAVALPLAGLEAWNLYRGAQDLEREAREQALHLAQLAATDTAGFLRQAHNILKGLAARPAVRALDPARCDPLLRDFITLAPRFSNVATMTLDGGVVCSAAPFTRPTRMDPDRFVKLLRGPGELTVGLATPGTITGRWAVPVGLPLLDAQGRTAGAVGLAIDLVAFPAPSVEGLPAGSIVGLMAADGTILTRSLEAERFVGTKAGAGRPAQAGKRGTAELMGIDGIARIQGFAPVPGTDWMAIASLPAAAVYAPFRARTAWSASIALAAIVAVLVLAVRLAHEMSAPVRALGEVMREAAAGNLGARAPVEGVAEIAAVASEFNRMLEARDGAERALRASEERFRRVFASASLPMSIAVENSEALLEANDAFCTFFGYARAELVGRTTTGLGLWLDPAERREITARLDADGSVRGFETRRRLRSGEVRDVLVNVDRIELAGERCTLAILNDITERKRVERERAAAYERFEKVFRSAPVAMAITTLEQGRIVDVNEAYCILFGFAQEELVGNSVLELDLWGDAADRQQLVERLRAEQRVRAFEARVRIRGGEARDVLAGAERIDFLDEPCMLIIASDITARKRAEQAQLQANEQQRQLIDNLFSLVGVLTREGILVDVNRTALQAAGMRLEDVLGKPVEDTHWIAYSEESRLRMREAVRRAAGGEPVRQDIEIRIAEGRLITIDFALMPVRDARGRVIRLVASGVDITERKRMEEALRENQERLRLFIEHAPAAIAMFDRDMRYVAYSRRWLADYGLGNRKIAGLSHYEVFPDLPERWREIHRQCLAGAVKKADEDPFPRADGSIDWVRWEVHPWRDATGGVGGIIIFSELITERKRAEEELRGANERTRALSARLLAVQEEERAALARELHDELGQALTALKLSAGSLARKPKGATAGKLAELRAIADTALKQTRSLALDLRPPQLDQLGLVAALRDYVERIAAAAGLKIRLLADERTPEPDKALATAAFRIVQEALTNVVRHAKAKNTVVELRAQAGELLLAVADDGIGFDHPAARERAIRGGSIGILSIEERVALAGGRLQMVTRPGQGTRVQAAFPLKREPAESAA